MSRYLRLLPAILLFLSVYPSLATHNRGGEIMYKRIAPYTATVGSVVKQVYTYSITVIKYTDHGPGNVADRCVDTVHFGDGTRGIAQRINGPSNCGCSGPCGQIISNVPDHIVKLNVYSITHTYPGPGNYLIRTFDPNRNDGVINMLNSVNVPFYLESYLVISTYTTRDNDASPVLMRMACDIAFVSQCFKYSAGAYDSDGDSLSYEITTSRDESGQTVPGYFYPDGSYSINAVTGMLTWCSPAQQGEYALAYIVKQWRRRSCSESYQLVGYVLRDMQVIVHNFPFTLSASVSGSSVSCVQAGATVTHTLSVFTGSTSGTVQLSIYGSSQDPTKGAPASLSQTLLASGQSAVLTWPTSCASVKEGFHHIVVACTQTTTYMRTAYVELKVLVSAPSPEVYDMAVDTGKVILQWHKIPSCYNVIAHKVYRKFGIGSLGSSCSQGNPPNAGYTLLATLGGSDSSFTDFGVWAETDGTMGNYFVTAVLDNCSESAVDSVVSRPLVNGVNGVTTDPTSLRFFPSPFAHELVIEASRIGILEDTGIRIFSVEGSLVAVFRNADKSSVTVDTRSFAKGLYIVEIRGAQGTFRKKVIKD